MNMRRETVHVPRRPWYRFAAGWALVLAAGCGDGSRVLDSRWPDGSLKEERTAIVGERGEWLNHGPFTTYYQGGKQARETGTYVRGQLEGVITHYYATGAKKAEGRWEQGRLVGKWKYWDRAGNPIDVLPEEDVFQ